MKRKERRVRRNVPFFAFTLVGLLLWTGAARSEEGTDLGNGTGRCLSNDSAEGAPNPFDVCDTRALKPADVPVDPEVAKLQ